MDTQHKTQNEGRTAFLHVRIEPDVLSRFATLVASEHRSVSQDVRRYIDERLSDASEVEPLERAA